MQATRLALQIESATPPVKYSAPEPHHNKLLMSMTKKK
jgi:hypothetical protein